MMSVIYVSRDTMEKSIWYSKMVSGMVKIIRFTTAWKTLTHPIHPTATSAPALAHHSVKVNSFHSWWNSEICK